MTVPASAQSEAMYDVTVNISNFIKEVVGHDRVFYGNTNFPRPTEQYLTYRVDRVVPMNRGAFIGYNPEGKPVYSLNYKVDVEIYCYKEYIDPTLGYMVLPTDVISTILHRIHNKPILRKHFLDNRIGHLINSSVDDRSIPLDEVNWEQRARALMTFHFVLEDVRDTDEEGGYIETVNYEVFMHEGDETNYHNNSVTYPPPP